MKLCIAMDGSGHFNASNIEDREKTIKVIKKIHDGDYWYDILDDIIEDYDIEEKELLTIHIDMWNKIMKSFVQRGTMEIVEI